MSLPGIRPMIVYCAGVPWDGVQGTDRRLALSLLRHVDLLWVDPPLSIWGVLRRREESKTLAKGRLLEVMPGLMRLTTVCPPFPNRTAMVRLTNLVLRSSIRSAVKKLGVEISAVVVSAPLQPLDVLRQGVKVFYATDDFVAGATLLGLSGTLLKRGTERRVEEADIFAVISPQILENLELRDTPAMVLPNGCDIGAYAQVDSAPLPDDVSLPAPIAGVVGQLSSRIDISLLEAVAARGISLLMVGPVQDGYEPERFAALIGRPNVAWVGLKNFSDLPSYMRLIDVGLTPYTDSQFNRASFPLKTLEYLAAGRMVVSTPMPAVDWLDTSLIAVASDPASFALETAQMVERTGAGSRRQAREFAGRHSWDSRAAMLLDAIEIPASGPRADVH